MRHIEDELAFATWCLAAIMALQVYGGKSEIVVNALHEEVKQAKERIFFWLSYIYDADVILNAKSKMAAASSNEWALILEALDQTLDSALRTRLFPLYERLSLDEQFARLNHHFPQDAAWDGLSYLEYIIGEEGSWIDPWLRTSAIYAAPKIAREVDLSEALYVAVRFNHPMVAETALWSLSILAPSLYKLYISRREQEPSDLTSKTVGVVEDTIGLIRKVMSGGEQVLLTIEKVLILKKVSIFADTSEEFLADISTLLDELNVSAGVTIIEKGEELNYLYIITEGDVEVRNGEHLLAELGRNDIFGELGMFLEAPTHTASVIAKTNVHILRLHREDFTEILYDYAQVAHGIIRELAHRLHQSNQRIVQLTS
jgi:Cyclic nucleotide-binding domain